ncbi:hypothetical protein BGZ73_008036 [Actinomortierella ambigua]|nr:hypothetical protein BGZ73_008036 [Actinomortierella ambigua]
MELSDGKPTQTTFKTVDSDSDSESNMTTRSDLTYDNTPAPHACPSDTPDSNTHNDTQTKDIKIRYDLFVPDNPQHNKDLKHLRGGRTPRNPLPDKKGRYSLNDHLLNTKTIMARYGYVALLRNYGKERYLPEVRGFLVAHFYLGEQYVVHKVWEKYEIYPFRMTFAHPF